MWLLLVKSDDAKRRVLDATDIVRLIGEQVTLRSKGKEYLGLCPFHEDTNPSMYVSPAKQIYKCFSCGAGGDAFSFVMDYHKMSFPEALRYLAERNGIELPEYQQRSEPGDAETGRDALRSANDAGLRFFRKQLADEAAGQVARDYLNRRGVSDAMIEAFGLGYAPDSWNEMATAIQKRKASSRTYEAVGLIGSRQDGSGFDKFRHRLIFPIFDAIGRPIAFGGRKLRDEDEPKYLNSAENTLFNKSATLYGLHLAKKPIIDSRTAVIVEGYTDVIACHQAGFTNVVATLGTALTHQHAVELRRYCDKAIMVFDPDAAGQKAADRAVEVFFSEPVDVAIAILPDGLDPADLLAEADGADRWRSILDQSIDAMDFHYGRIKQAVQATDTLTGRQRIAEDYLRTLAQLGLRKVEPARRGMILHRIAQLLKLDTSAVDQMLRQAPAPRNTRPEPVEVQTEPSATPPSSPDHKLEQAFVGCLLNRPDLFHAEMPDGRCLDESVCPADLKHPATQSVFACVHAWLSENDALDSTDLRSIIEDEHLLRHALDLKLEASRMNNDDHDALGRALTASAERLHAARARDALAEQRLNDSQEDDLEQRLLELREHVKTHNDMSRLPRMNP